MVCKTDQFACVLLLDALDDLCVFSFSAFPPGQCVEDGDWPHMVLFFSNETFRC